MSPRPGATQHYVRLSSLPGGAPLVYVMRPDLSLSKLESNGNRDEGQDAVGMILRLTSPQRKSSSSDPSRAWTVT